MMKLKIKKVNIRTFLIFLILLLIMIGFFRRWAIFFIITLAVSVFVYVNYYIKLPFDISPVLFLSLVITREYGFLASFVFIIVSGIFPMVMAGGSFDHTTLFYLSLIFGINFVSGFFTGFPYIIVFIAFAVLHHVIALIGSLSFGNNPYKEFMNLITKIIVDVFYIFTFSAGIIQLMG